MRRFVYIASLLLLVACKKEENTLPTQPEIEFISISDIEVEEFDNSITLVLNYKDKEGDIGQADPDAYSLRVKDARLEEFDWYHIPPITPDLQELQTQGTLSVQLNALFLLGNGETETTYFTIQLKDRAGNWSNQIQCPEITIVQNP